MSARSSSNDDDHRGRTAPDLLTPQRARSTGQANRSGYFPLGYRDGFSQWWANVPAAVAEHTVMSFIPYLKSPPTQTKTGAIAGEPGRETDGPTSSTKDSDLPRLSSVTAKSNDDPYGPRQWHSELVQLNGKDRALNEFSVERTGEANEQNLVMLHGYGAGLGFFYKNFEGLSRSKGWKIYALDLLGMGRSSRPPFKIHAKDRQASITEAENWFIDALEEWRIKRKIERFTLLGHSLGGYLAVAYALKYPGHLNKLILASPVGIPEDPYAVNAAMPDPPRSSLQNDFTQDQGATTVEGLDGDNNDSLHARSKREAQAGKKETQPPSAPQRPYPRWLVYLWDANISPFSLVRWAGPLGPRFVSGWTSRRFSHLPPEEAQALHTYAYTLFKQRGSGEYALSYILAPGAFARSPLIRRIDGVGRQLVSRSGTTTSSVEAAAAARQRETGIPVVLMYGEHDWMDIKGGYAAEKKIQEARERALREAGPEERKRENGGAKVLVIKRAGHHVYLDGWEEFNDVMGREMEDTRRTERELASPRQ